MVIARIPRGSRGTQAVAGASATEGWSSTWIRCARMAADSVAPVSGRAGIV
jgi:hypothetical protein